MEQIIIANTIQHPELYPRHIPHLLMMVIVRRAQLTMDLHHQLYIMVAEEVQSIATVNHHRKSHQHMLSSSGIHRNIGINQPFPEKKVRFF